MVAGLQPRAGNVDTYRASGARRLEVLLNDMLMQRAELLGALELRLANPGREAAPVVLLLNVDRFEVINDNLGPLVGQHALELIRRRIQTCLRRSDMLARLRGDEFGLLLGRRTRVVEATMLAERIADALRAPLSIGGHQLTLTVSIGIASGEGETSPVQVLRNADIAMCQAKAAGRARYSIFDPHMRQRAWERMRLETDLRRALVDEEFVVHYQPIVDLASSEPVGHEALVRWQHHKRGLVPPSEFIPGRRGQRTDRANRASRADQRVCAGRGVAAHGRATARGQREPFGSAVGTFRGVDRQRARGAGHQPA
jgi:diguanylate cyclase (GGDEF)-like protein